MSKGSTLLLNADIGHDRDHNPVLDHVVPALFPLLSLSL